MPNYRYKAVNDTGKLFKGIAIAFDKTDMERHLNHSGLSLIKAHKIKESALTQWLGGTVSLRNTMEFYHRLAQTLEIGLPILSALEENGRYLPSKTMRKIVGELKVAVECGHSLYEAMEMHPKVFKKLDLAIIRMGEQTGVLPACLKQIAAYLKWKDELRAHVRKATIYPSFIIIAILAALGVWVGYVLPKMVKILSEMNVSIPQATLIVLSISEFVQSNWLLFGGAGILLSGLFFLSQRTKRGRLLFHRYILKVPLIGNVLSNISISRLCRNFATMFNAGMAIQQIFSILSNNGLGNRHLEARLKVTFKEIEGGETIARGFEIAGDFPSLLLGAIRNGEATGTLDQAFQRLGDYFDEEVKRTVQVLLTAIEPMAIISLAAIFGLIVLSILLPLYDVMGSVGKAY